MRAALQPCSVCPGHISWPLSAHSSSAMDHNRIEAFRYLTCPECSLCSTVCSGASRVLINLFLTTPWDRFYYDSFHWGGSWGIEKLYNVSKASHWMYDVSRLNPRHADSKTQVLNPYIFHTVSQKWKKYKCFKELLLRKISGLMNLAHRGVKIQWLLILVKRTGEGMRNVAVFPVGTSTLSCSLPGPSLGPQQTGLSVLPDSESQVLELCGTPSHHTCSTTASHSHTVHRSGQAS